MGRKKISANDRSRNVCFILYPDNLRHMECLELLKNSAYDCNWIKHDRGLKDDPDATKEHYHVTIAFLNARSHDALANELGIERNLIQKCHDIVAYLYYTLHWDFPEKHQYQVKDICGSKKRIMQLVERIEKETPKKIRFKMLFNYINNSGVLRWSDFIDYAYQQEKIDLVTKHTFLFKTLIDEHNFEIRESSRFCETIPKEWRKE